MEKVQVSSFQAQSEIKLKVSSFPTLKTKEQAQVQIFNMHN